MSEAKPAAATASVPKRPMPANVIVVQRASSPRLKPGARLGVEAISRDAQRVAAVILEVLAGVKTPTEAAVLVGLSVPRYYLWEQRALEGLVRACEPRPKGKVASTRHQIAVLEKEVARLRLECARQQALVRASQRTIGLAGASPPASKPAARPAAKTAAKPTEAGGKAKRKRRPVARALKAVAALQAAPTEGESPANSSSAVSPEMVQRSVLDNLLQAAAEASSVPAAPA